MRDPARIPVLLDLLSQYWATCPDMRLGQLVFAMTPPGRDPFNLEDDALIARLRQAIADHKAGSPQ